MNYQITTNLFYCQNQNIKTLESLYIKNLKRQDFNNYRSFKSELFKRGITVYQIYTDLYFFRLDKDLKISKMINLINSYLLKTNKLENQCDFKALIDFRSLKLSNELISHFARFLLSEMFVYGIQKAFSRYIYNNRKKIILIILNDHHIHFKFQFFLDYTYSVYLAIDPLIPNNSHKHLMSSLKRYNMTKEIIQKICNINFFLAGNTLKFNNDFLNFQKECQIVEC
ncbi:MAG: hypothetical protein ACTSRP_01285 [Candidatus Helarchaeota archaeon]